MVAGSGENPFPAVKVSVTLSAKIGMVLLTTMSALYTSCAFTKVAPTRATLFQLEQLMAGPVPVPPAKASWFAAGPLPPVQVAVMVAALSPTLSTRKEELPAAACSFAPPM